MRIGICAEPDKLNVAIQAGADYIECSVVNLMKMPEGARTAFSRVLSEGSFGCEVLNILFPGREIPLTGGEVDFQNINDYAENVFKELQRICQPEIVIFGSGGARNCPEGFDKQKALGQLIETGRILAEAAGRQRIAVALEPLNRRESNMVNNLTEAVEVVKQVNKPNFKLVADFYHMLAEDEPASALYSCEGYVIHTHIATKERLYPQREDMEIFAPFFDALREIGYDKRMSIEAGEKGNLADSVRALIHSGKCLKPSHVSFAYSQAEQPRI
jgi:sugar phosphate isomerase/epimerase